MQHITYTEWLPVLLHRRFMETFNLNPVVFGYETNNYNPDEDPTTLNEFATVAFRFGHSNVASIIETLCPLSPRSCPNAMKLEDTFFNTQNLFNDERVLDAVQHGRTREPMRFTDLNFSPAIRDKLFQDLPLFSGGDLAARNIQRGRDHGIPGYRFYTQEMRDAWISRNLDQRMRLSFGTGSTMDIQSKQLNPVLDAEVDMLFPTGDRWEDIASVFQPSELEKLRSAYSGLTPFDVDLFPAGLAEKSMRNILGGPGTIGPAFSFIIAEQFRRLKEGDRFFYTNPNIDGGNNAFTPAQLNEIRKVTAARLICDLSNDKGLIQKDIFKLPNEARGNGVAPCSLIPKMDFSPWKTGTDGQFKPPGKPLFGPAKPVHSRPGMGYINFLTDYPNFVIKENNINPPDVSENNQNKSTAGMLNGIYSIIYRLFPGYLTA